MKRKTTWLALSFLMAISLVLASCGEAVEEEEEEEEAEYVDWWDKFGEPEYGGRITVRTTEVPEASIDSFVFLGSGLHYFYETLFHHDWKLDRDIWPMSFGFVPEEYWQGLLAESWEVREPGVMTIHIREGVTWQDKPPVNGREFTAYDVENQFCRQIGRGCGYTEPSPFYGPVFKAIDEVIAIDKYTVDFKFKTTGVMNVYTILDLGTHNNIGAPESVEQNLLTNWEDAVGTGAWMLTDYITASSVTFSKNPKYWGYDERHPENRLPYADELRVLSIPDIATAMASLRTGKIDLLESLQWEQADSLKDTNPDLEHAALPNTQSPSIDLRCDREPFSDINVRKAVQMALDRELIAETHYGGTVEGTPYGRVSPLMKGWLIPHDEWPRELQDEYSYNPERARELLAEAGYPNGFSCEVIARSNQDLDLLQIIQAQLKDIGVDMDLNVMEPAAARSILGAGKFEHMVYSSEAACTIPPTITIGNRTSAAAFNYTMNNDPIYEALYQDFMAAATVEEAKQAFIDSDMRAIEQHWAIHIVPTYLNNVFQSYLKGYSGEWLWHGSEFVYARLWVDQDLKESMGR